MADTETEILYNTKDLTTKLQMNYDDEFIAPTHANDDGEMTIPIYNEDDEDELYIDADEDELALLE